MEKEIPDDGNRRNFLIKLTSVVGGAGVAATCVPFVASMNPSSDVAGKAETDVDLSGIPPEECIRSPGRVSRYLFCTAPRNRSRHRQSPAADSIRSLTATRIKS